jgi:hypothetical protein
VVTVGRWTRRTFCADPVVVVGIISLAFDGIVVPFVAMYGEPGRVFQCNAAV